MKEKMKREEKKSKKKTVGAISSKLLQEAPLLSESSFKKEVKEIQVESQKDYIENLIWAVKHAKKEIDCSTMPGHENCKNSTPLTGNFFIVVTTKKEKLMQNVLRNYFYTRQSCPTPSYDQSVFKFDSLTDNIEYLWTLPSKEVCEYMSANPLDVKPEERQLLGFVLDFNIGELMRISRKLNGEDLIKGIILEEK